MLTVAIVFFALAIVAGVFAMLVAGPVGPIVFLAFLGLFALFGLAHFVLRRNPSRREEKPRGGFFVRR